MVTHSVLCSVRAKILSWENDFPASPFPCIRLRKKSSREAILLSLVHEASEITFYFPAHIPFFSAFYASVPSQRLLETPG